MWSPPERIRHSLPIVRSPSAEEATRARLFSPLRLASGLVLESRAWVPAMVPWRAREEGDVTDEVVEWYGRFAQGRPGAIVVEATGVRDVASGPLLRISDDRFVPGLRRIVDEVRARSGGETRIFIQLIDFLRVRRRPDPARFFGSFLIVNQCHRARLAERFADDALLDADDATIRSTLAALAARDDAALDDVLSARELEALRFGDRERVNDVHLHHIAALPRVLPDAFAAAAARAQDAGFDGVELHYAHAYTMASFLSATNTRDDGYGRTRDGRLQLPLEVIHAVRARVGDRFTVGARMLCDEAIAGGSGLEDACAFGVAFARAGLDFLSLSTGGKFDDAKRPKVGEAVYPYTGRSGYECMPTVVSDTRGPFARNVPKQAAVRSAIRASGLITPTVVAGGIATFAQAESILARREGDLIGSARQSLADPDWFAKVRLGRERDVRRCSFTNYCEALDQRHEPVTCQRWDRLELDVDGVRTFSRHADGHGRRRLVAPPWLPETQRTSPAEELDEHARNAQFS
jgi:2,4-dienoyl-CoA reductase-like NADH-dependent reductase (Old Yellow Enzyme family)